MIFLQVSVGVKILNQIDDIWMQRNDETYLMSPFTFSSSLSSSPIL